MWWNRKKEKPPHFMSLPVRTHEETQALEALPAALTVLLNGKDAVDIARALKSAMPDNEFMKLIVAVHYVHKPEGFDMPPHQVPPGVTLTSKLEVTLTG
jgi:hypothetical protein